MFILPKIFIRYISQNYDNNLTSSFGIGSEKVVKINIEGFEAVV